MVIAKRQDDKIVVGISDRDSLIEMCENDYYLEENLPFWKVNGEKDCFVCSSKVCFSTNLLRYNDKIFKGITDGKSIMQNVVPKIKGILSEYLSLINDKSWDSQLLIIKGNKMFTINNYFNVTEIEQSVALGYTPYLNSGIEESCDMSAEESILFSVRGLETIQNIKLFPIVTFNTKTKKKKVHYK